MKIRKPQQLALLIVLAFVLVACGADTSTLQPEAEIPTVTPPPLPPSNQAETPTSQPEIVEPNITEAPEEPAPTPNTTIPMPELGFDYGAPALKASDLSQFVSAAGKPQLVELFAFW